MKVACPKCGKIQEVKKDDFLGRYFVCRKCHNAACWYKHSIRCEMNTQENKRNEIRFEHESTVLIENHQTGKCFEGKMSNYSTCGACIYTDYAPQPGSEIFIGIENSPYSGSHDIFRAKIVWCSPQTGKNTPYCFRIGAKYC